MPIDNATALAQIDAVNDRHKAPGASSIATAAELITLTCAAIQRLAPPGSAYLAQMQAALEKPTRAMKGHHQEVEIELRLHGILQALRADYEAGRLQTFEELIHADLFSDFLEMAAYFLEEGYKDPAAVIAGGVLEEHLRKLCGKHGVTVPPKPKLDSMNSDLAKAGAYNKNDQKQATAWAGLRNDAAHGNYTNYGDGEVKLMVAGIRDFISRNPA